MSQVTFDRVLALNKELAALSAAGLALELGGTSTSAKSMLDRANASLALRTSLGQPLADAVENNDDLPGVYRNALEAGLRSGDLTTVLDGVSQQAAAEDDLQHTFGQSFVQPLILLGLAYVGLMLLCLLFSPTLEGIYKQVGQQPNAGVAFLRAARNWLPVWGPLTPLLMIAVIFLWRRGTRSSHTWIPWASRYVATTAHANFADQLAKLVDKGVALPQALELASGVTGDKRIIAASAALATAVEHGEELTADDARIRPLPPLLRWTLTGDLGDQSLPDILRFAAQTYRQSAERQAAIWRVALPTLIGALVGGVIVFAYALSMFGPLIQLLKDLAA